MVRQVPEDIQRQADALKGRSAEELQARQIAIGYIGVGKKTSGRVRDRLLREGVSEHVVEPVLDALREDGYLDDAAMANAYIRSRIRGSVESAASMRARLLHLGIAREAVDAALSAWPDLEAPETVLPVLRKKIGSRSGASGRMAADVQDALRTSAYRYLRRRGFSHEQAMRLADAVQSPER